MAPERAPKSPTSFAGFLQVPAPAKAGTYKITVTGAGGTQGNYTLQAVLNAVYKSATGANNSTGSAYDLSGAFGPLGTTPAADRAGDLAQCNARLDQATRALAAAR